MEPLRRYNTTNLILSTHTKEHFWLATAAGITAAGILLFEVLPMSSIQTVAAIAVKQQAEHNTYPITAITSPVKTREEDEHVIAIPSHGLFLLSDRKSTNLKSDQNEEVLRTVDSKTRGKSKRILIVDDEPDITITFKKALRDKRFEQVDIVNEALLA
jgi:hypothetical protein